ncbi:LysR family transcriptional regulator, partial [Klebsiella pneumoniae]|nr:LysR family transcriptional regulator [Klebsiella pneumoniae]
VIAEQLASRTLAELKVPLPRLTRTPWRIPPRQKHISKALQRFLHYCQV